MIVVTGANGLLGSFIIRKLLEERRPFVALKRQHSDTSLLTDLSDKITWCDADVLDVVSLEEAFRDASHVIHAAATVSFNPRQSKKIFDVNVNGTRNVVNACLANKVKRLVHISSVAALGRQKGQTTVDEENKWTASTLNSTYAETKYLAELEVQRGQEEGISTVMLNPSLILAPADWTKSSAKLFKYVWDEKPFYFDGNFNYVDVRDVAGAACQLLDAPFESQRFIVNAGFKSYLDFFTSVAKQFNRKAPRIKLGPAILRIAAVAESIRSGITSHDPLITKETIRLAGSYFYYSNTKIKEKLDFQFHSFEETIEWCCRYYLKNFIDKK